RIKKPRVLNTRPFILSKDKLEQKLQCELQLSRIADALTDVTIKVEQARSRNRKLVSGQRRQIHQVLAVERIEHLDRRDQLHAFREFERTRQTPVEREVFVILSERVAVSLAVYQFKPAACGRWGCGLC